MTAKNIIKEDIGLEDDTSMYRTISIFQCIQLMNKFANQEVTNALEAASKKAKLTDFAIEFLQEESSNAIDKDSILNAYKITK